jgi:hypothetical protein
MAGVKDWTLLERKNATRPKKKAKTCISNWRKFSGLFSVTGKKVRKNCLSFWMTLADGTRNADCDDRDLCLSVLSTITTDGRKMKV